MKGVRLRVRDPSTDVIPEHHGARRKSRKYLLPTPTSHFIAVLCFLVFIFVAIELVERKLPTPLRLVDAPSNPGKFIAERAMNHLMRLTDIGPRTTGSYENEVLAIKFFEEEIGSIMDRAKPIHNVQVDIQKTSGAFPLHFLDGMTNVYRDVQNVIVRVSAKYAESAHSLLVNCHFDTVSGSPGGSDDGASCAIMLEILHVITQMEQPLKHNLILLFNGAEENLMQASHGFITQHKWAKEVRAFINLEACGAGGREILFQAGPNHPWIMQIYSESVPYPYASSLAQEIFQSGVIPGDTDFRIFRDFGHVSGLDFAWSKNGYVYHTKFDNVRQIPLGTLQRTGENILALTLAIANNDKMANTEKYASGNLVFFDFLGAFVIRWPEGIGLLINSLTVAVSVFCLFKTMKTSVTRDMEYAAYVRQLAISSSVAIGSLLLILLANLLIALTLTALGRSMSWFARPVWIFFLYICPTLFVPMVLVLVVSRWQRSMATSAWTLFQLYSDGYQIMWILILLTCTVLQIRSGFIALLWIFFAIVENFARTTVLRHWRGGKWLMLHVAALTLPFTQCLYLVLAAMSLYVPIMGRSGAGTNSEVIVGLLVGIKFGLLFTCIVPLILLVKSPERILSLLSGLFLIAVGLLILTPLGFPYSADPAAPAPQRFMIAHADRTFHDVSGNVKHHDTGYWIVDMDQNSPYTVKSLVQEMANVRLALSFIWKTHWIPGPPPMLPLPTELHLNKSEMISHNHKRLNFTVTGPDHIGVMLSPVPGVTLDHWSLDDQEPLAGPKWNGRDTYFVYYAYASEPKPLTFSFDLKGPRLSNRTTVDVAVSSHFMHGPAKSGVRFRRFLSQFPPWTDVTAWTATYASWKF
ncbi:endoplasmic reticulum metallopeptidase 1-like [Zootermopsis nevadensis]|uniref:endoplasmic reticulum metallopeptidase 1-like n=1 Tax=Zootermopsis nevadensis TaxID=136037 RepID=UPI000B8E9BF9|nr:endoplasmic reticulum metallopeptidase 1-like [Zootermopsis nevadensis]